MAAKAVGYICSTKNELDTNTEN